MQQGLTRNSRPIEGGIPMRVSQFKDVIMGYVVAARIIAVSGGQESSEKPILPAPVAKQRSNIANRRNIGGTSKEHEQNSWRNPLRRKIISCGTAL
jgi:hypothetical protein